MTLVSSSLATIPELPKRRINTFGLQRKPKYDELVNYIERDPDKLKVINRDATIIRNGFELSQLDGEGQRQLNDFQTNLLKQQEKESILKSMASSMGLSHPELKAATTQTPQPPTGSTSQFDPIGLYQEGLETISEDEIQRQEQLYLQKQEHKRRLEEQHSQRSSMAQQLAEQALQQQAALQEVEQQAAEGSPQDPEASASAAAKEEQKKYTKSSIKGMKKDILREFAAIELNMTWTDERYNVLNRSDIAQIVYDALAEKGRIKTQKIDTPKNPEVVPKKQGRPPKTRVQEGGSSGSKG
jgi:hypothetical protein